LIILIFLDWHIVWHIGKQNIDNEDEKCEMEAKKRTAFVSKMAEIISPVTYYIDGNVGFWSTHEIFKSVSKN